MKTVITQDMFEVQKDALINWFSCPKCGRGVIYVTCNYCSNCGIELDTSEIADFNPYKKQNDEKRITL